jgi:hypothetical protein
VKMLSQQVPDRQRAKQILRKAVAGKKDKQAAATDAAAAAEKDEDDEAGCAIS